jgi:hypothetical protein
MTIDRFISYMMRELPATDFDEGELAAIITHLDAWIANRPIVRIVNPTSKPRRVIATFDKAALRAVRQRAAEAFSMKE